MNKPPELALVEALLKPPMWLIGIYPANIGHRYTGYWKSRNGPFNSLEELMAGFRFHRPEGRWIVRVRDADGQVLEVDSQKWDLAKDKV